MSLHVPQCWYTALYLSLLGMTDLAETDEALMLRYQGGDADAFDLLYARHRGGLYRFIQRQCRNPGEGKELFQEVWINVIQARKSYRIAAQFRTWLYTLAHHRLIDYFRKYRLIDSATFAATNEITHALPASRISRCGDPRSRTPGGRRKTTGVRQNRASTLAHPTGHCGHCAANRIRYFCANG